MDGDVERHVLRGDREGQAPDVDHGEILVPGEPRQRQPGDGWIGDAVVAEVDLAKGDRLLEPRASAHDSERRRGRKRREEHESCTGIRNGSRLSMHLASLRYVRRGSTACPAATPP
jgi:hypothetical protein